VPDQRVDRVGKEKIDKIVGRRIRTPDAFQAGMKLQTLAVELHRSLKHRWAPKGVYRFKTHREVEEWMYQVSVISAASM
jgi:hypothetical protein